MLIPDKCIKCKYTQEERLWWACAICKDKGNQQVSRR